LPQAGSICDETPRCVEPVHGLAPDIAGQNIANLIGQIWSGAMMLEHLRYKQAGDAVVTAIETVLRDGPAHAALLHQNQAAV